jgi:Holliday junction resolvase
MSKSQRKGASGEREIAAILNRHGFNCRRGRADIHEPDVIGLPGVHLEIKRQERLNLHEAMAQSIRDAAANEIPVVVHCRSRSPWFVTLTLSDWLRGFSAQ